MKKRILALLLAAAISMSLFAGCAANSGTNPSASTTAATTANESGSSDATEATAGMDTSPITITVMNRLPANFNLDNNAMFDEVERLTGVRLEVTAPPIANYSDRLQLTMASGNIPDIIYTWEFDANYEKWANDGMLYELTDEDIAKYPNLTSNINQDQWNRCRVGGMEGSYYAVPRPHPKGRWAVVVNDEWLEKLGTTFPTTVDELYEVAKLIATGDPDGNGKDDTFLYSPTGLWSDCWLIYGFMPFSLQHAAPYMPDPADGEYKIKEKMTGYFPYLDFVRKLYAEKLMDPEWFTNNYYDDRTKFEQNRVGFLHNGPGYEVTLQSKIPDALEKYSSHPGMLCSTDPDATLPRNESIASTWGGWMINADVDQYKLERILSFLDWANSPEGFTTIALGVQGVDYETYDLETRIVTMTQEMIDNPTSNTSAYMNFANAYMDEPAVYSSSPEDSELMKKIYEEFDNSVDQINVPVVKCPEIDNWSANNPDIASKKEELEVKYVCGEVSREEFENFLNNTYFPSIEDAEKVYIDTMKAYDAAHS